MSGTHRAGQLAGAVLAMDRTAPPSPRALAIGALGMGVPVATGMLLGQAHAGFLIGLGAVLLAGGPAEPGTETSGNRGARLLAMALPALAAVVGATLLARLPAPDSARIALVALAALTVNYSRPVAAAAIRFNIYLVLGGSLLDGGPGHGGSAALIFGLGALWNILLRLLLDKARPEAPAAAPERRAPTLAQRRAYFRRQIRTFAGWQFPFRLAIGLGIASLLRHAFPAHHYYWIVLTVALLTEVRIEPLPAKTLQRLLGTLGGVALAWLLFAFASGPIALGIVAAILAALVPLARARSYLLYAVVSAPLILLVIDLGKPVATALLVDRLVATLAAGAIVVALNQLFGRLHRDAPSGPARSRPAAR